MQVDEKALVLARQAYQASIPDGAWHADGGKTDTPMRAAITAYLAALGEREPAASADEDELLAIAYMQGAYDAVKGGGKFKFPLKSRATKTKGSSWTGRVVGFYSTTLTPIGYAVESENEPGSVQIYPEAALEAAGRRG